MMENLTAH